MRIEIRRSNVMMPGRVWSGSVTGSWRSRPSVTHVGEGAAVEERRDGHKVLKTTAELGSVERVITADEAALSDIRGIGRETARRIGDLVS
jgi:hypothetical protein